MDVYLFLVYGDEICRGKPFVTSYVVDAVLEVAVTFREIHLKQVAQEFLQLTAEMRRKPHLHHTIKVKK